MKAETPSINGVFKNSTILRIPFFQRQYVWEEKQWRELLDDLKYCLENENISSDQDWTHFLGSFVFEKNQKDNKLVVIDGQQRLTTIIIMLCAICVLFNEAGEHPSTFIKTSNAIYRMQATNKEKCSKYADVVCKYKLKKDATLTEYNDKLLAYNGSLLITDYGRVFSVSM